MIDGGGDAGGCRAGLVLLTDLQKDAVGGSCWAGRRPLAAPQYLHYLARATGKL